ncbi:NB-ARC domain-containing protein [Coleofasciculus sp. E2-BRE-01]|uniref:NB-ARC domain-containing protein n=1 Tax=Coleofasciculus sp. E2-BRE-01 TaxID=3069524 RepID=UPI00406298A7
MKKFLLETEETTPGTLVVSAIYGLGGIGKSVLATALAHDPDIHQRFSDGILWVTLGQQPDILSFLATWIHALGDFDYKPTTPQAASTHLRTLLYDKRSLLVVDDAWKSEDVELFQVGGSNCRVLVTTREAPVRGAIRYDLDIMSPAEALELLNKCRPGMPMSEEEQKQALDLAKALGYLPLALELAAAQIAEGVDWWELLEDFQAEVARLETLDNSGAGSASCEETRKRLSLNASFNLSLRQLSPEQLQQFAWLGVLPEDVSIGQQTAAVLWQVKPRQAGAILRTLRSKALLLSGAVQPGEKPTYRIHDLMHDRAKELLTDSVNPVYSEDLPGLGLRLKEAHAAFLERYRAKTENGQWYTLSNDGYIHNYLTWHLEKAGQSQELHQLLQASTPQGRNAWYEACDRIGKLGNFVTDVARAWRLAEQMYEEKPSESIGLQCRYALIFASLNSLADNIQPELMAALVEKQIWTPEQGLAYAQQKQNPGRRAEALGEIAPHLPETLLPEALEAAQAIQDERYLAQVLGDIAPHLPETLLPEALEAARAIQEEHYRAQVLGNIAPHLPETLLSQALEAARAIHSEGDRAIALGNIAPHLPETLLSQSLEAARAIHSEGDRAIALGKIALHLPDILPEALEAARAINSDYLRAYALGKIAPYLPDILPEVLEATRAIHSERYRAYALEKIAPYLPDILPEALEAARAIHSERYRAIALWKIAPYLPETLLSQALEAARAIQEEHYRACVLSLIAPHLPETLLSQALEVARAILSQRERALALGKIALYLPEILPEALEAARAIQDEEYHAKALGLIAPYLPEILPEALEAARGIQDEEYHAIALGLIAPHLPDILPEALEAARAIQDEEDRAIALGKIAPHLPETLLSQALEAARAIHSERYRAIALGLIAPHLPDILPEALEAVRAIQDEEYRVIALGKIAPHLPETLLSQALEAARGIQDEFCRAIALGNIAPHLPEILPEELEAVRAIHSEEYRAYVLGQIAPYLPEILPEALEAARAIQDERNRAVVLGKIAPHLPETLLSQALEAARSIHSEEYRTEAFGRLLPNLKPSYFDFPFWKESLDVLAYRTRKDLLEDISALSPVIIAFGGKEALAATARAIQEVGRQWT